MKVERLVRRFVLAAAGCCLLLAPVTANGENEPKPRYVSNYLGVSYELLEQAHDGEYSVPPERKVRVDANSDLVLKFLVRTAKEMAEASPKWKSLNKALDFSRKLVEKRAELNAAQVDLQDENAVRKFQKELEDMDAKVNKLVTDLKNELGIVETAKILGGDFQGSTGDPEKPYDNLALWIKQELARLQGEARRTVESADKIDVLVEAYLDPQAGELRALHVENYDELPIGELAPVPRASLQLSEAEQSYLLMAIDMNQRAAEALREIRENHGKIKENIKGLQAKLQERLDSLEQQLRNEVPAWASNLAKIIQELRKQAQQPGITVEKKQLLESLALQLEAFQQDYQALIQPLLDSTSDLKRSLASGKYRDLAEAILAKDSVVQGMNTVVEKLGKLKNKSPEWKQRAAKIASDLESLRDVVAEEVRKEVLPEKVKEILMSLADDFPKTYAAIQSVWDYFNGMAPVEGAANTLSGIEDKSIWHGLTDPPDARIEMDRAGWRVGDRVTVVVRFREKDGKKDLHKESYRMEAILTGLHREVSANLIFARASSGTLDAKKWKPNVAALVNWHYYVREPTGFWGETLNWLGPGAGIHLASLDQGEDSVEFGVGANLTLWRGLVTGGVGYNLSVSQDQRYFFLGINLFDVLNRATAGTRGGYVSSAAQASP